MGVGSGGRIVARIVERELKNFVVILFGVWAFIALLLLFAFGFTPSVKTEPKPVVLPVAPVIAHSEVQTPTPVLVDLPKPVKTLVNDSCYDMPICMKIIADYEKEMNND